MLADRAQDQPQHDRSGSEVHLPADVADESEEQHHVDVEDVAIDGVGADHGQKKHQRRQQGHREAGDQPGDPAAAEDADRQNQQVGKHQREHEGVGHRPVGAEQLHAGAHPVQQQRPEEHGRRRGTGNPQGEKRDERAGHGGIVRHFRGHHSVDVPLAEGLGVPGGPHRFVVGDHRGDVGSRPGNDPDHGTDHGGTDHEERPAEDPKQHPPQHPPLAPVRDDREVLALAFDHPEDFRNAEEADEGGNQGDAALKADRAKSEAHRALDRGNADHTEQEAEGSADQALQDRARGQSRDDGQPEGGQPEELRRPEAQGETRQRRREKQQKQDPDQPSKRRGYRRRNDRLVGLSALGHREAVEGGGDRRRGARGVQQDRRKAAPVDRRHVDPAHQNQAVHRLHGEGERDQQGDRHGGGEPGQSPHNGAGHHGHQHQQKADRLENAGQRGDEQLTHPGSPTLPHARLPRPSSGLPTVDPCSGCRPAAWGLRPA